ncbi:hypothetical protein [Archangium sp.]|jgi:hypothetical protein|uniref:hypothetical protein n=1 Tax=Archangium sp. TaxID=1872627 RepID=UPI002ED920AC
MSKTGKRKTFIDYELPTRDLEKVRGGKSKVTTLALNEEGGTVTTEALGEECGGTVTTQALGEEATHS